MKCILEKTASTNQGSVGDIITFNIKIINPSKINFFNVIVKDLLPSELKFVLGSVVVDYVQDSYSNILSGVNIGNIDAGKCKIISFDAQIIRSSKISVFSDAVAEYSFSMGDNLKSGYACSEIYEILVKNPSLLVVRECDREDVLLDDIIKYTVKISNNGDVDILNLFLIEKIPSNIKLIDGTFCIDGTFVNSVELEKGIMIEGIPRGCTKIITYCTCVYSSNSSNVITTSSFIKYSYILQNGLINYKENQGVSCSIKMAISSFKQVNIDECLMLNCDKPDIEDINDLKANIDITSYNVIKTSIAKSSEGKILSGYKLIIHGVLNQILEYVADDIIQSVHTDSFCIPFSSYIILPKDFNLINKITIEPTVENIYYSKLDKRSLFESINILLLAKSS